MTNLAILNHTPAYRLQSLQAQDAARFIACEAGILAKRLDYCRALAENQIIERVLMGRVRKVLRNLHRPDRLEDYLMSMRDDYHQGRRETLSVLSMTSEDLSLDERPDGLGLPDIDGLSQRRPQNPLLLYVPGGGFILPPSRKQKAMVARLAKACDCTPILGAHALAPEAPFPRAPTDIADQYERLLTRRGARQIFLAGDTAGASIVMGALQIIRQRGIAMPAGVLLFSPWCDLSLSGWSYITRSATASSPFRMETAAFCAKLYLQDTLANDPVASAVFANLEGFPPISLHTSQHDMHFDDAITLAERAKASGVDITLNFWDSPRHHLERLNSKDAKASFEIAARFIKTAAWRGSSHAHGTSGLNKACR